MQTIRKSDLFKEIEGKAMLLECEGKKLFTAERFIVALIDTVNETPEEEKSEELLHAEQILRENMVELEDVRSLLGAYVHINKHLRGDIFNMFEIMEYAARYAIDKNYETVEAGVLLATIFANPSGIVKEVMRRERKKGTGKTRIEVYNSHWCDDEYYKPENEEEALEMLTELGRALSTQLFGEESEEQAD